MILEFVSLAQLGVRVIFQLDVIHVIQHLLEFLWFKMGIIRTAHA